MRQSTLHSFIRALPAFLAILGAQPVRALYTKDAVTAYRVADDAFTIDGRPDSLWRTIYAHGGSTTLNLQDYSKMVLLQPEKVRNEDPSNYVKNPRAGTAALMAAYDSKSLYFFFLIKAPAFASPKALGCAASDLWKVDAAEIYVDPSPWSADSLSYQSYFTADASGLIYGTSPRTIQVDKPISYRDTGFFYRDRKSADRFQVPASRPAGVKVAASPRTSADTAWVGVEMKIPFWTTASDFAPGRSMFLSWGYNFYADSARQGCPANPLAYRWAKNYLNYDAVPDKPPGWHQGDSTHYDPTRSWDGWGQLLLSQAQMYNQCHAQPGDKTFDANWDPANWQSTCQPATPTRSLEPVRFDAAGMPLPGLPARDALGRAGTGDRPKSVSPAFLPPR